jgi:hypothetical protein
LFPCCQSDLSRSTFPPVKPLTRYELARLI